MPVSSAMVPYFDQRVWCVLEFDDPVLFTCDEPVALVGNDPTAPGDAGGLARARAIVFPTDPHRALVLLAPWVEAFEGRYRGGPRDAEVINRHVAFNAHRFLARRPGVPSLDGMTIPKKAPSAFVPGNLIAMQPHASEAGQAKAIQRMKARGRRR
jgi:hypothetical protein